jgi:phosphopantetheine--protein transferase-like protein
LTEVRRSLQDFGTGYNNRVFTSSEAAHRLQDANPAPRLASMFATQEAVIKLLACSDPQAPRTAIDVSPRNEGGFEVRLVGVAAYAAQQRGIDSCAVSVSRGGELATAVVFAMGAAEQL